MYVIIWQVFVYNSFFSCRISESKFWIMLSFYLTFCPFLKFLLAFCSFIVLYFRLSLHLQNLIPWTSSIHCCVCVFSRLLHSSMGKCLLLSEAHLETQSSKELMYNLSRTSAEETISVFFEECAQPPVSWHSNQHLFMDSCIC